MDVSATWAENYQQNGEQMKEMFHSTDLTFSNKFLSFYTGVEKKNQPQTHFFLLCCVFFTHSLCTFSLRLVVLFNLINNVLSTNGNKSDFMKNGHSSSLQGNKVTFVLKL